MQAEEATKMDDTGPGDAADVRRRTKGAIVEAALTHAAFDGWTDDTVLYAAAECEVDSRTARRLFPRGGKDLLAAVDDWLDRRMLRTFDPEALEAMPVRKRIAALVRARFEPLDGHEEAMRRAALAHAMPWAAGSSARRVWRTADRIWEAAGFPDTSADGFSRYSRRGLLVGILASTYLYWLDDRSPNHADSWAFLDRRIDDALKFGRTTAGLTRWLPRLPRGRSGAGASQGRP
ncbi:MAG: COQ9 family protein [Geminicoccaceae bacterium]|nr:COQ9 family protein [Geminicoccaceae bacterium]